MKSSTLRQFFLVTARASGLGANTRPTDHWVALAVDPLEASAHLVNEGDMTENSKSLAQPRRHIYQTSNGTSIENENLLLQVSPERSKLFQKSHWGSVDARPRYPLGCS
jgi:hypothetical protein